MSDTCLPGAPSRNVTVHAVAWLALGVSHSALIDGIAKELSDSMGVIQITWARFAFFLLPLLLITPVSQWSGALRGPQLGLNLFRASLPCVAGACAALAVATEPLDLVTAIIFAAPLMVTALAGPFLGEKPGLSRWAAVIVGFGGVLVIARPWNESFGVGILFALALAFLFAIYQLLTRKLTARGNPRAMLLQVAGVGFVMTTILLPFDWVWPDWQGWAWMVASGLTHLVIHFCMLRAFSMAPASTLAPVIYFQIVVAIAFGYVMFGDVPDLSTLIGAAIVMACGLFVVKSAGRPDKGPSSV